MSILLDAGPSLNFLAVGQESILIQAATAQNLQLAAPARVDIEIIGMSKNPSFARTRVNSTWTTLKTSQRVKILPDELATQQFTDAVTRISGMPANNRVRTPKSLGEIMVLAHASVFAQQGTDVFCPHRRDRRPTTRYPRSPVAPQPGRHRNARPLVDPTGPPRGGQADRLDQGR